MVDAAIDHAGVREPEPWWSLIRLAFASPARVAMVQAQDVLGLGGEARMNMPGTTGKSWRWGLSSLPSAELGRRLREAAEAAGRVNGGH
jgi:4-alpha-glucanotransferase